MARQLGERYPVRMDDPARVIQGRRSRARRSRSRWRRAPRRSACSCSATIRARARSRRTIWRSQWRSPGGPGSRVENARLAGEQAEVARVLQRGLRPAELPAMRGFEVATMYRPAGEVNEVGGDFYEAFEIEGGWMLAIGDVVGRGAAAASVTALARYTIRTAGKLTGDPRAAAPDAGREPQAQDGPVAVQCRSPGASRRRRRSRAGIAAGRRASPAAARAGGRRVCRGTAGAVGRNARPAALAGDAAGAVSRRSARPLHRRGHRGPRGERPLRRSAAARQRVCCQRSDRNGGHGSNPRSTPSWSGLRRTTPPILVLLRSGTALPTRAGRSQVEAPTSTGRDDDAFGRGAAG